MIKTYYSLLFLMILCSCGVQKNNQAIEINGKSYISVTNLGVSGDGKTDDTDAIQRALDTQQRLYFPKGNYRLGKAYRSTHTYQCLTVNEKSAVRDVFFADGASLEIPVDVSGVKGQKVVVLKIWADQGDISQLTIHNLAIKVGTAAAANKYSGVFAIEHQGNHIQQLTIDGANLYNLSNNGIVTYALRTTLTDIHTENTGKHGISARNPYNPGEAHYLTINGHTSINDFSSINCSGAEPAGNPKAVIPGDFWEGDIRNVQSIGSGHGIKTAGNWNLYMENIEVIGSDHYGFFVNKNAPDYHIKIKNLTVENARLAGISLSNKTNVEMQNVRVIGCPDGVLLQRSLTKIDSLLIDGKGKATKGLRIPSNAEISNFTVTGITGEYPVWVIAGDVTLRNGKIIGNDCRVPIMIKETAGAVVLDNVQFDPPSGRAKSALPQILNRSKRNKLTLIRMDKATVKQN